MDHISFSLWIAVQQFSVFCPCHQSQQVFNILINVYPAYDITSPQSTAADHSNTPDPEDDESDFGSITTTLDISDDEMSIDCDFLGEIKDAVQLREPIRSEMMNLFCWYHRDHKLRDTHQRARSKTKSGHFGVHCHLEAKFGRHSTNFMSLHQSLFQQLHPRYEARPVGASH